MTVKCGTCRFYESYAPVEELHHRSQVYTGYCHKFNEDVISSDTSVLNFYDCWEGL